MCGFGKNSTDWGVGGKKINVNLKIASSLFLLPDGVESLGLKYLEQLKIGDIKDETRLIHWGPLFCLMVVILC